MAVTISVHECSFVYWRHAGDPGDRRGPIQAWFWVEWAGRPIAKRRAGFSEPPTPDLHRKRIPRIHHIQRVIALTDIPCAIGKNEIGLAKAELCPSPETDLDAAREPFASAL